MCKRGSVNFRTSTCTVYNVLPSKCTSNNNNKNDKNRLKKNKKRRRRDEFKHLSKYLHNAGKIKLVGKVK